ncbi:hypothetical protein [Streptomyces sp. H39-C1]|uniref:hypothetical protein n=1 Tax=Streptomyces sp. H39-C1 TaxID=3004355 RepID=UPI0022AE65CE|nr:hypothetical protein [Streptomyces sp. H39-C1]MCZ4102647.1 hypothetical protein [Streptomyces sp. H39-C1]
MTDLSPRLDTILGAETAAQLVHQLTAHLAHTDALPADVAFRLVCERMADADPLLLAAPGQVWVRHPDTDPGDVPAHRLAVRDRLTEPPRVIVTCLDGDAIGDSDELLLDVLHLYQLESWQPIDVCAPWIGQIR